MKPVFALVDCNNFFVSCERIFRPDLQGKPVVVLSSNDGCVVARSNEAKALGVPMGAPAFKHRETFRRGNVVQFSANFELYGNVSKRITRILSEMTPRIEVYSVDESFLDISTLPITDFVAWGRQVRKRIWQEVGVPVSIGIAPTKTLAKLGTEYAKKDPQSHGVISFMHINAAQRRTILSGTKVEDIWGVGWRLAPRLRLEGYSTAWHVSQLRPQYAQQLMGIHGRQLVSELHGTACHQLTQQGKAAKSIMRSRTFGEDSSQAHILEAAIATLASRAAFHLRGQELRARKIGLFTMTNRHKPGFRRWSREVTLPTPTNDTGTIIAILCQELAAIFSPEQKYHRLGVFLYDLLPENAVQADLFGQADLSSVERSDRRMQAIDAINSRWGRHKIRYAAEDLSKAWQPKHQIRSPRYVSRWEELPVARILRGDDA